jgi:mannosyltransferase OCH1-like enzyme
VTAIPRIFHQIWIGEDPFPREYAAYQKSWLKRNPGWELRFWREENLPSDLRRTEVYERLRQPAERSDLLRLEVLHRYGGVYVDSDFECRRPLEPLLEGVTFFVAYLKPGRINNAIVGSVPGHPILERAIGEARPRETWGIVDKHGTGPHFLGRMLDGADDVTIFDPELFYPRTPDEEQGAIAVHRQARSWQDAEGFRRYAEKLEARWAQTQDEVTRVTKERDAARARVGALEARLRGERRSRWRRRLRLASPDAEGG